MKKIIAIAIALFLVATIGAGVAVASSLSSNGVPAQKTSLSSSSVDYTGTHDQWVSDPDLTDIAIHTANNPKAALLISYTGEAALTTDVQIKGTGGQQTSTSSAYIKVRALIDDQTANPIVATPGDVYLNYRLMTLTGLLWSGSQVGLTTLPTQFIDIYEKTRSANGFNWYLLVPGGGTTHTVTIQYYIDTQSGANAISPADAIVGKRTLFVELDNVN